MATRKDTTEIGNCYEKNLGAFLDLTLQNPETEYWLCHGTPLRTKPPHIRMGHAWIEYKLVIEMPSLGMTVERWMVRDALFPDTPWPREFYYKVGKLEEQHVVRYATAEVMEMIEKHDHYGPWDPAIQAATHAEK